MAYSSALKILTLLGSQTVFVVVLQMAVYDGPQCSPLPNKKRITELNWGGGVVTTQQLPPIQFSAN